MSFETETSGLLIPATWKIQLAHVPSGVKNLAFCSPLLGIFAPFAEIKLTPLIEPKEAQLKQQIKRAAYNAFIENAATK